MKAFTIDSKIPVQDGISATFSFALKRNDIKTFTATFENDAKANLYLEKAARDWFLGCLDNWVKHKEIIICAANHHHQLSALQICKQACDHYQKQALKTICSKFLNGYNWFVKILPNHLNPSYQTSLEDLLQLQTFCEKYK
jgi:hypothetical protein